LKTWWKEVYPVTIYKLIRYKDTVIAFGGDIDYTVWDEIDWGDDIS